MKFKTQEHINYNLTQTSKHDNREDNLDTDFPVNMFQFGIFRLEYRNHLLRPEKYQHKQYINQLKDQYIGYN